MTDQLAVDRTVVDVFGDRDDVVVVHEHLAGLIANHHRERDREVRRSDCCCSLSATSTRERARPQPRRGRPSALPSPRRGSGAANDLGNAPESKRGRCRVLCATPSPGWADGGGAARDSWGSTDDFVYPTRPRSYGCAEMTSTGCIEVGGRWRPPTSTTSPAHGRTRSVPLVPTRQRSKSELTRRCPRPHCRGHRHVRCGAPSIGLAVPVPR